MNLMKVTEIIPFFESLMFQKDCFLDFVFQNYPMNQVHKEFIISIALFQIVGHIGTPLDIPDSHSHCEFRFEFDFFRGILKFETQFEWDNECFYP